MASTTQVDQCITKARSLLFVPGDRPEKFRKAMLSQADVVIIDWEASVIPERKAYAREATSAFLNSAFCSKRPVAIRVNPARGPELELDLAVASTLAISGLFLTMVETSADVTKVGNYAPAHWELVAMVETAVGVFNVSAISLTPRVSRLAFGNMDYQTDLRLGDVHEAMIYPSSVITLASRCAGLPSPIAGVTADFSSPDRFIADASFERSMGFGAKLCIHPKQIAWCNRSFATTQADIQWAKTVIEATRDTYATQVDGVMIDRPVIERARRILED
ncbi:citrate lyase beta subunit [Pseudomonas sp. GM84]|uniref:HpcH/HpaI aldolase/citrate lyase family protein n=1 Tax=Pseudomonas sp. GM84 TaxID=1144340 RepID=UPI00026F4CC3|nr:CoA ester lyase [Pseudomonas sp. GM84]EJN39641.1 citrate lyase beta subunit [Pseudomonas sp. GM84]